MPPSCTADRSMAVTEPTPDADAECLEVDGVIEFTAAEAVVTATLSGQERDLQAYNAPAAKCMEQLLRHAPRCNFDFSKTATSSKISISVPAELVQAMPLMHELIHCSHPTLPEGDGASAAEAAVPESVPEGAPEGCTSAGSSERKRKLAELDAPAVTKFEPPCSVWGLAALVLIAQGRPIYDVFGGLQSDPALASHTVIMADFLNAQKQKMEILTWLRAALAAVSEDCKAEFSAAQNRRRPADGIIQPIGGSSAASTATGVTKAVVWWYTQVLERVPPRYLRQVFEHEGFSMAIQDAATLPASLLCKWLEGCVDVGSKRLSLRGGALSTKHWESVLACCSSLGTISVLELFHSASAKVVAKPNFSHKGYRNGFRIVRYKCDKCLGSFDVCDCYHRGKKCECPKPSFGTDPITVQGREYVCSDCKQRLHYCRALADYDFPFRTLEVALASFRGLTCLLLSNVLLLPEDIPLLGGAFNSVAPSLRTLALKLRVHPDAVYSSDAKQHLFSAVAQLTQLEELVFPYWSAFLDPHSSAAAPLQQLQRLRHVQVQQPEHACLFGITFIECSPEFAKQLEIS